MTELIEVLLYIVGFFLMFYSIIDSRFFVLGPAALFSALWLKLNLSLWMLPLIIAGGLLAVFILAWVAINITGRLLWRNASRGTEDEGNPMPMDGSFKAMLMFFLVPWKHGKQNRKSNE